MKGRGLRLSADNVLVKKALEKESPPSCMKQVVQPQTVQGRLLAKGRLKTGEMNKTEARYAQFLAAEKQAGRVQAYWFESIKLKIAEGTCWLTPDFLILRPNGDLELHDVKGSLSPFVYKDDAKVKMKVVATSYPFKTFVVCPKSRAGGWEYKEY